MLTFNQKIKDDLLARLEDHPTTQPFPSDHSQYEKLFGIPEVIAKIKDRIHGGLPDVESEAWALRFSNAVPVETDLSGVWPGFAMALMVDKKHGVINNAKTQKQRKVIEDCADLYKNGPDVDTEEATKIIRAATSCAADASAVYAAHYAAAASSYASYASYAVDAASSAYADDAFAASSASYAADAYDATSAIVYGNAKGWHYIWMADKLVELMKGEG